MATSYELKTINNVANNLEEFGNSQSTPPNSENNQNRSDEPLVKSYEKQGIGYFVHLSANLQNDNKPGIF